MAQFEYRKSTNYAGKFWDGDCGIFFLFWEVSIDSITIVSHIRCWLFSKHKRNRRNLSQLQPCVCVCVWLVGECDCVRGTHHVDCLVLHLKLQQQVTFRGVVYNSHIAASFRGCTYTEIRYATSTTTYKYPCVCTGVVAICGER